MLIQYMNSKKLKYLPYRSHYIHMLLLWIFMWQSVACHTKYSVLANEFNYMINALSHFLHRTLNILQPNTTFTGKRGAHHATNPMMQVRAVQLHNSRLILLVRQLFHIVSLDIPFVAQLVITTIRARSELDKHLSHFTPVRMVNVPTSTYLHSDTAPEPTQRIAQQYYVRQPSRLKYCLASCDD